MKQTKKFDHKIDHNFCKDCLGIFLFILTHIAIILQIVGVYITPIIDNSFQRINNNIFYFCYLLAIISHIRASCEDPGKVRKNTNPSMIWLYIKTNTKSILIANELNNHLRKEMPKEEDNNKYETSDDETPYEKQSTVSNEIVSKLAVDYKIEFDRCSKCYVVKLPKTQHCNKCKG